jgi:uncharacterized membrane protein YjjP (DUF1212 family)
VNAPRPPSLGSTRSLAELADTLVDVGATLLAHGCPTHRLEGVIRLIAVEEASTCEVFAVPTGLWLSVRRADPADVNPPVVRMVRVKEWQVNLDRLAAVDRVFNDVLDHKLTLAQARAEIDRIEASPPPYWRWLGRIAPAIAAGASAVFFRGGWTEVGIATLGGVLLVLVGRLLRRRAGAELLADFLGGLIAAGLAWGATAVDPALSREVLVLSVVILLVPGMALTTGLAELVNKNLVSGAARLMEAMITFLSILFGIAVVIGLEQALDLPVRPPVPRHDPPLLLEIGALVATAAAFVVLFSVPRRFAVWAMVSGAIGWVVTGQAARHLPPSLGAFLAAASVMLYANACARLSQRPAQVFLLPGLILLVPGSFGFLSLEAFLRGEFLGGAAKGFEMFLVAAAIVTGLLVANVILPAKKIL